MAITEHVTGSQTATINTEHTLNTTTPETTDGIYQVFIDIDAMALGDITEIRVKEKARTGDTQRTCLKAVLAHDPSADDNLWVSPALVLMNGWDVTLKQTAGTGRAYPWSIRKIA
jgi:hypothetical protein